jgi:rRNA maturation RNase YbeY
MGLVTKLIFKDKHYMPVYIIDEQTECSINCETLENQIKTILPLLKCQKKELSILLTDDKKIRELNKQYRNKSISTDVLSFSQNEGEENGLEHNLLGDIVISISTAMRQSSEHNLSIDEEIVLLLIHGILHLLGFDHERSEEEAVYMKEKTSELFSFIFPNKKPSESCSY